ncbi:MAG: protein kinase [Planctomycetota bacterium]
MSADSTNVDGVHAFAEDTRPHPAPDKHHARVRRLWRISNYPIRNRELAKIGDVHRLRSLILDLALEEYEAEASACGIPDLSAYCTRFRGLGQPLESSLRRLLDVQQCFDSYIGDGQMDRLPDWPAAGEAFGEFDILETLGQGSAGRVYLARQQRVGDRVVVLKVSPDRGQREGHLLGKLRHPHIVSVHWVEPGSEGELGYILMPFLGKSTLGDYLEQAKPSLHSAGRLWMRDCDYPLLANDVLDAQPPLPCDEYEALLVFARQLAGALEYAHRNGVIHGDIKPSNVLLSPGGRPYLIDFNLGRERDNLTGPTGGTLPYMAPELLRVLASDSKPGNEVRTSQQADVFAFGMLMSDFLTAFAGKPLPTPPAGGSLKDAARQLLRQREAAPIAIRELDRRVSARLEGVVSSCLRDNPAERPSAAEVYKALSTETGRWPRKRRALSTRRVAAACGVTVLIVGSAAALILAGPADSGPALLHPPQLSADDSLSEAIDSLLPAARNGDARSAAFLAFALQKHGKRKEAFVWYSRALELGYVSAGTLNNLAPLAADYFQGLPADRYAEALELVDRAEEAAGPSVETRVNRLRICTAGYQLDVVDGPGVLLPVARTARADYADRGDVMLEVVTAMRLLAESGDTTAGEFVDTLSAAVQAGCGFSRKQLETELRFRRFRGTPDFARLLDSMPAPTESPATIDTKLDPVVGLLPGQR